VPTHIPHWAISSGVPKAKNNWGQAWQPIGPETGVTSNSLASLDEVSGRVARRLYARSSSCFRAQGRLPFSEASSSSWSRPLAGIRLPPWLQRLAASFTCAMRLSSPRPLPHRVSPYRHTNAVSRYSVPSPTTSRCALPALAQPLTTNPPNYTIDRSGSRAVAPDPRPLPTRNSMMESSTSSSLD
jgi:hypothetical protein